MRLLSEHPEVVVHRWHPYELRTARYWWHMLKTLSEPRDPHNSAQADHFQTNKHWIGYNPFYPEPIAVTPGLGEWMGRDYVEELARFCQRCAEETYLRIAAGQGQTGVKYMAEKHRADNLPGSSGSSTPRPRKSSSSATFGMSIAPCSPSIGRFRPPRLRPQPHRNRRRIRQFPAQQHHPESQPLLAQAPGPRPPHPLRNLITKPEETLRGLIKYLELDASDAVIAGMMERASAENPEMKRHLTSTDVATSLGRWKSSLTPELQTVANNAFGDVLQQFGYQV